MCWGGRQLSGYTAAAIKDHSGGLVQVTAQAHRNQARQRNPDRTCLDETSPSADGPDRSRDPEPIEIPTGSMLECVSSLLADRSALPGPVQFMRGPGP